MFKKILLLSSFLLLFSTNTWGALSCPNEEVILVPGSVGMEAKALLILDCKFDAVPGTATKTLSQATMDKLDGYYIYLVETDPGVAPETPPDAASMAITDSRGKAFMTAAVNGLNLVHATAYQSEYTQGPNGDHYQVVHKQFPLTFTITDQATNNADLTVYVEATLK